jgi:hypothetical protein
VCAIAFPIFYDVKLIFARLIFDPEDRSNTVLRNITSHKHYTELYPRRWQHLETRPVSETLCFRFI